MKRARAIAREIAETERQTAAMVRGFERLERAFKRAGVEFYQENPRVEGGWLFRQSGRLVTGPFKTKTDAMADAQCSLIKSGVWK